MARFLRIFFLVALIVLAALPMFPSSVTCAPNVPLSTLAGQNGLVINQNFSGTSILLFGTKPLDQDLAVIVLGPKTDYLLNTKYKILGLWIGRKSTRIKNALAYHASWATKDLFNNPEILSLREIDPMGSIAQAPEFEAFSQEMESSKMLYRPLKLLTVGSDNLFNLSIELPKNLKVGNYAVKVYSFQNLIPKESIMLSFEVRHSNFNGLLSELNRNYPKTYLALLLFVSAINVLIFKIFLS